MHVVRGAHHLSSSFYLLLAPYDLYHSSLRTYDTTHVLLLRLATYCYDLPLATAQIRGDNFYSSSLPSAELQAVPDSLLCRRARLPAHRRLAVLRPAPPPAPPPAQATDALASVPPYRPPWPPLSTSHLGLAALGLAALG